MRRVFPAAFLVPLLLLALAASSAAAERPPRGYSARPCGFDLDGDGVVGEPNDDCRVCDGMTLDPDGDGVNEDLLYIDADFGSDTTGDGSPQNPYRTIQHAWGVAADGPQDGAEDILCFCGTAREQNITPGVSGVPGVDVSPRSGSQARDFEFPSDPTMLVGWDTDRDGCYPPYDDGVRDVARCGQDAEVALLDGAGLDRAFEVSAPNTTIGFRYLEMAHFSARDYGFQTASSEAGFLRLGRSDEASHIYLHDLEIDNINRGKPLGSRRIAFSFFTGGMRVSYLALVNIAARNFGGYFARGSFGSLSFEEAVRFQNIKYLGYGCSWQVCGSTGDAATVTGLKLWSHAEGLEVLDSVFDSNSAAWNPRPTGPTNAVVADACTQDWTIRNNLFLNWSTALIVKGADGFCETRPVDDVLFDSNHVMVDDAANFATGAFGVSLSDDGTSSPEASVADVTVVNNFFYSEVGWRRLFFSHAGNELGEGLGTVVFAGNTVYGHPTFGGWALVQLEVGVSGGNPLPYPLPRFRFENNIFTGFRSSGGPNGRLAFKFVYQPSQLVVVARNTFDPAAAFHWLGTTYDGLVPWRSATGLDPGSRACIPELMNPAAGDLHLTFFDSCAINMGGNISSFTLVDIDGDVRPLDGTMHAGADGTSDVIFADGFESGDTSRW